jgi:hypothetical protein
MQAVLLSFPTLAVAVVYCAWAAYRRALLLRRQVLHERVAYLLWVAANACE